MQKHILAQKLNTKNEYLCIQTFFKGAFLGVDSGVFLGVLGHVFGLSALGQVNDTNRPVSMGVPHVTDNVRPGGNKPTLSRT